MERDKNEIALFEAKHTALSSVFSVLPPSWVVHVELHKNIHKEKSSVGRARSRMARTLFTMRTNYIAQRTLNKNVH